jgi:uncharacterized protein YjlB
MISPQDANVTAHLITASDNFPNNNILPLLVYHAVFSTVHESDEIANAFEQQLQQNGFQPQWRYGVYPYHHYHSNTHEILGVFKGNATLQFGGDNGIKADVKAGDMVVIPAGIAHKCLNSQDDFCCVGAYPSDAANYDMNYGKQEELDRAQVNISKAPIPQKDPIYENGPLAKHWRK